MSPVAAWANPRQPQRSWAKRSQSAAMMAWTRHGAPSAAPAPVSLALVLAMSLAACCRAQVHPGVDGLLSPEIKKQMEVPNMQELKKIKHRSRRLPTRAIVKLRTAQGVRAASNYGAPPFWARRSEGWWFNGRQRRGPCADTRQRVAREVAGHGPSRATTPSPSAVTTPNAHNNAKHRDSLSVIAIEVI